MLMSLLWCCTSLKTISTCTQGALLILTTYMTNELSTARLGCKAALSAKPACTSTAGSAFLPQAATAAPGLPTCPCCPASPPKMGRGIRNTLVQCYWAITQSTQKYLTESKDLSKVSVSSMETNKQTNKQHEHLPLAPALSLVLNSVLLDNTRDLRVSVFQLRRFPKEKLPQELPVIWEHGWTRARITRAEISTRTSQLGVRWDWAPRHPSAKLSAGSRCSPALPGALPFQTRCKFRKWLQKPGNVYRSPTLHCCNSSQNN